MGWAVHVARIAAMRNSYKIFVVEPEGKSSRERPRHRREDNLTQMDGRTDVLIRFVCPRIPENKTF
jgi:hypothetical protein